jgi:hypothetical protein
MLCVVTLSRTLLRPAGLILISASRLLEFERSRSTRIYLAKLSFLYAKH